MRKTHLMNSGLVLGVLALTLMAIGCSNPLVNSTGPGEDTGSLRLLLLIPDFDARVSDNGQATAKLVSPSTSYVRIVLDSKEFDSLNFMEIPLTPITDPDLGTGRDGEPMLMEARVGGIPSRYYDRVTVELLDDFNSVLSTGSAFGVQVEPYTYTPLHVTCFVGHDHYIFAPVGGDAVEDSVLAGEMAFYKFYGYADTNYTVTATSTVGEPDLYLYKPTGAAVKTADQTAYLAGIFDPGSGKAQLTSTVDMTGMYVLGVYGFGDSADFSFTIEAVGAPMDPAIENIQLAYGALRDGDWTEALSQFSAANLKNPSNPTAIVGYAALSIANIMLDSRIQQLATDNLGIVGYPTSINELFSPDWMERHILIDRYTDHEEGYPVEEEHEVFLPEIQGQWSFDGVLDEDGADGIMSPDEKLVAFLAYALQHNSGLNDLASSLVQGLNAGFGLAKAKLLSAPEGAFLELTWDMLFDTYSDAYDAGWPQDSLDFDGDGVVNEPLTLAIGKEEILVMTSVFEYVQALAYMSQAYNYSLLREDGSSYFSDLYDLYFDPSTGAIYDGAKGPPLPEQTPFSILDFLRPNPEAETYLAESRNALHNSLVHLHTAIAGVRTRVPADGFYLCPENIVNDLAGGGPVDGIHMIMDFVLANLDQLIGSFEPEGPLAYLPIPQSKSDPFTEMEAHLAAWPSEVAHNVVGLSMAAIFENPLVGIVETTPFREPIWYKLDTSATPQFAKLSISDMEAVTPAFEDFYFIRMPESVFTQFLPPENFHADDPTTVYAISSFSWYDSDGDGMWNWYDDDPTHGGDSDDEWDQNEGEQAVGISVHYVTDSGILFEIIDIANLALYRDASDAVITPETYYGGASRADIIAWIDSFIDDTTGAVAPECPLLEYASAADVPGLMSYLQETHDLGDYKIQMSTPEGREFMVYKDGSDLYFKVPDLAVWHSVTPRGTIDPDTGTKSTGTAWFSWASMMGE